jgi:hypothetical protein
MCWRAWMPQWLNESQRANRSWQRAAGSDCGNIDAFSRAFRSRRIPDSRGWNQRVTGFPIVPLVLQGVRFVFRGVNSLPAQPSAGRTPSPSPHGRDFEHEDEHEHEEQRVSQQPLATLSIASHMNAKTSACSSMTLVIGLPEP